MDNIENIPKHVAIIMDGNGRWAEARGLPKFQGHDAGMKAMKEIVKRSDVVGVKHLTVYAFSTENWKRSEDEVSGILKLLMIYVERELSELITNNVKVDILGDYTAASPAVVKSLDKLTAKTKDNTGLQFHIAFNYGSRAELARATRSLAGDALASGLAPEDITDDVISARLWTGGIPDPDLIIRPGGEIRLSNFLLWQAAYAELIFTDILWPDFTPEEFDKALEEYGKRKRRFGGR
jgi:undecaprenyl diphosphate synthase